MADRRDGLAHKTDRIPARQQRAACSSRASGTEPLVRIMLEGQDERDILDKALSLAHIVVRKYDGKDPHLMLTKAQKRSARDSLGDLSRRKARWSFRRRLTYGGSHSLRAEHGRDGKPMRANSSQWPTRRSRSPP
ncbi:MAG: hypothetical protein R2881_09800 [Eubacteriales bacterium]